MIHDSQILQKLKHTQEILLVQVQEMNQSGGSASVKVAQPTNIIRRSEYEMSNSQTRNIETS